MGVIYKITSPTNRIYIGKTFDLDGRIANYKHHIKTERYNTILFNSLKKYGWDAHSLEIIEDVENEKLEEREIFWISELKTYWHENPLGMNMTKGGECGAGPWMHNLERRKKQAKAFLGEKNPFYGKKHTEENKRKQGIRTKERNLRMGYKVPQWGAEKGWQAVRKEVIAYNNIGDFIGEYRSLTEAAKKLNVLIQGVKDSLIYNQWHLGKYMFKYKTENYPIKIEVGEIKLKTERRPVFLLNEEYEVMAEYPSSLEASIELKIPKTTINRAAMYNWMRPIRTGHIFFYKDMYEELPEWMKNPIEN